MFVFSIQGKIVHKYAKFMNATLVLLFMSRAL